MSSEKKEISDKEFLKTMVRNNSKILKAKYGHINGENSRIPTKLPSTQTCKDINSDFQN